MSGQVLVVDDHAPSLKLARVLLMASGYDVLTAGDADEAMSVLRDARPGLVLMDIEMPRVDGLTLTRQLKADPRYRDIPIVALTARAMKGDDLAARAAGCDGYVAKPIDTRTLPSYVARHLRRN